MTDSVEAQFDKQATLMTIGLRGAQALRWFDEYTNDEDPRLEISASVMSSATPNAEKAIYYVREATKEVHSAILKRAKELAQADFDAAMKGLP